MFDTIPLEVIEKIFCYLTFGDILSVFSAFNRKYDILSDYFWKTLCLKEDFIQAYETQEWYDSFQSGANKKLGYFSHLTNVPSGKLEHVYLRSIIISDENDSNTCYKVFSVNDNNEFILTRMLKEVAVKFRDEFILIEKNSVFSILKYNNISNNYVFFKSLQESIQCVFGINYKYCASYRSEQKVFKIYNIASGDVQSVIWPPDNKFIIEKVLHQHNMIVSSLTFTDGYKIKFYNIESQTWTLDLVCFGSTGITNDPNVWVGSNFVGCCDVSYRLRGIYFGPFKVWNKIGEKLFQAEIEPSNKHYLRCFFKEEHTILTTSDKTITVFNSLGESISRLNIKDSILDVKVSTGHLIFVLIEEQNFVEVYDWSLGSHLYSIKLNQKCCKSFYSDFLYCPIDLENKNFEVVKFI